MFGNTDFWASGSKETELQQGKNIVDASKKAGVQHLVMRYVNLGGEILLNF